MTGVSDERLLAVPERRAAQLAGITLRQLRYWHKVGLVAPSVDRRIGPRTRVRLYYFDRLLELLVAAELRGRQGISLQHIRRVVSYLRDIGYDSPLRQLDFATHGTDIYFRHPDGSWTGDPSPEQVVLHQVLELEPLRARIRRSGGRSSDQIGRAVRRRGTVGSKPVFAGTRLPVATVESYVVHGFTTAQILDAYPFLTEDDVEAVRRGRLAAA